MIHDEYHFEKVSPNSMDVLWEAGFRHFGTYFFRYNIGVLDLEYTQVLPLRVKLTEFKPSKSQKKILKKNKDLTVIIRECNIDLEKEKLFSIHAERFTSNKPNSIYTFISSESPANTPCELKEICVYDEEKLVAVSFLDIGGIASSSVYAMFHPDYSKRSLGIYTLLLEIEYSIKRGLQFLYPGYAYRKSSFYDYKKNFHPLEYFDWAGKWTTYINENIIEE